MQVHGYTADGAIDVTLDGARGVVPDVMGSRNRQMIAEWEFDQEGNRVNTIPPYVPPAPIEAPIALVQVAGARLVVDHDSWDISGIEKSSGISGAWLMDQDNALVFFADEFPDTDYIVMPSEGVTKHESYVEVSRPGLSSISFIVMRVQ